MLFSRFARRILPVLTLAALPLVVGSQCVAIFSSGGGSSGDDDRERRSQSVPASAGRFADPAVAGLGYASGAIAGTTGERGEFLYEPGQPIRFFVGDIALGPPVAGLPGMSVEDLVRGEALPATAGVNMRRLLGSLDADPSDGTITIPAAVHSAAVLSNAAAAASIEHLDFGDDDTFDSIASQLVALLTADYPFTAVLLDADEVAPPTRSIAP